MADTIRQGGAAINRAAVVVDSEVLRATPQLSDKIRAYGKQYASVLEFIDEPFTIRGGEICKRDPLEVEQLQALVERWKLCRHSYIIAIGGGAVLDAAGYAAATSHRGVRLIRIPTTVLAQNDAGIGVKNGINAFGRKNFLGTFSPPFAVLNDSLFLDTLSERDLRCGIAEAVKVALIRNSAFFEALYAARTDLARYDRSAMEEMIFRCAELHLQHIATSGDPFENGSSRPLDFGHWSAHTLEVMTNGTLKHGEAVALGIALDSLYSRETGLLKDSELQLVLTLLGDVGFCFYHPALRHLDIQTALAEFQEHLGGELSIPLLNAIGCKTEVNCIDVPTMQHCITLLHELHAKKDVP